MLARSTCWHATHPELLILPRSNFGVSARGPRFVPACPHPPRYPNCTLLGSAKEVSASVKVYFLLSVWQYTFGFVNLVFSGLLFGTGQMKLMGVIFLTGEAAVLGVWMPFGRTSTLLGIAYVEFGNSSFILDRGTAGSPVPSCSHRDASRVLGDTCHFLLFIIFHVVLIGAPFDRGECAPHPAPPPQVLPASRGGYLGMRR